MLYDYVCKDCGLIWEVEKGMSDPAPVECPECGKKNVGRYWGTAPSVLYPGRPIWTYNDVLKYKTCTQNGLKVKVDPDKHGSLSSWQCSGEVVDKAKSDN